MSDCENCGKEEEKPFEFFECDSCGGIVLFLLPV